MAKNVLQHEQVRAKAEGDRPQTSRRQAALANLTPEQLAARQGTELPPEGKGKKPKKERVYYPGLQVDQEQRATVKLVDAIPSDYDEKLHLPLRPQDFENEWPLLVWRAERYERAAAKLRKDAEICKTSGSAKERAKKKRINHLKEMLAKLEAESDDEE